MIPEHDPHLPEGVKGIGMLGHVGTAAAIAEAVYQATGKRARRLPIRVGGRNGDRVSGGASLPHGRPGLERRDRGWPGKWCAFRRRWRPHGIVRPKG